MPASRSEHDTHAALRVLVVSDSAFLRRMIGELLDQLGVGEIHYRNGGEHALEQPLAELQLILSGVAMTRGDGLALLKRIRLGDSAYPAEVPFVFVSDAAERWMIDSALHLDADGCILLPLSLQKLESVMALALGRSREMPRRAHYATVGTEPPRAAVSASPAQDLAPSPPGFGRLLEGARMLPLAALSPGMRLGADLVSDRGVVLLSAATVLSAAALQRLRKAAEDFGFESVPIV